MPDVAGILMTVDRPPRPADSVEVHLIERSRGGDLDAFDRLVAIYENRIYHLTYRITGNRDDALDAAQESFLKAFRALPRYRHEAGFGTWLHRIAVNTALDLVRRRPQKPLLPLEDVDIPARTHNPESDAERAEVQAQVQQALGRLPAPYRTIIVLRELQGFSYEEIAKVLGIPVGTVRSRLSRAREALRPLLADLIRSEDLEEPTAEIIVEERS